MKSKYDLITPVDPPAYRDKINYSDPITTVGSCFAEHISDKLARYKYNILSNPFGILFNPVSIANSFERIAKKELYKEDELVHHDGLFHSMDHHGSYSGSDKVIVLDSINKSMEKAQLHFNHCKFFFVSLGSAKVYRYKTTGMIVGNCHKIPQADFDAYRLSLDECKESLDKMAHSIKLLSPDAHIIWTVSPVRHLRDGLEENQLSKATLLLAIDQYLKDNEEAGYFPAYEIMMDELRDYRYYARDLTHPSPLAIDIIWDIFADAYFDPQQKEIHHLLDKIHRAMEHRFIHENKEALKAFAQKQLQSIEQLANLYPDMDWKAERQYFFQLTEPD